jgi:hypothetical protein
MKAIKLIAAVVVVGIAWNYSKKLGAGLLILIVLGMLYTAQKRGILTGRTT